ncbi:leukotriene B4 receptor 1-like [Scleropages formosus]|uniref:Leukotriene B4 receptor 1-like n=1 Tax=Scleropages formosus TaxID=113540 RepID=A0A0P7WR09_SCLFO|nr:leukotriene B4 receptor 1-like [Scleropages formosus]
MYITAMAQTQTPLNSSSSLLHALSSPPSNLNKTACENIICHNASTIIASLILGLVFLLGCPGNLFVIWSILARARKRSITTLLILHLACADGFLMTLTPFFVIYLAKKTWMFGNIMCKGIFYLCCVNMFASVLLIMLMSVYRMLAVVCPQRVGTLATRKAFLRLLVGVWLLVLIMSSPILAFREEKEENVTEHIRTICIPNANTLESLVMIHYSIETFFGFVLPYGVIVSCYVCILRRIRQTKFRRRIRSEKLILAIVVTFGLFWLPYQVINVMQSSRTITSTLAFVSSCANPVLYSLAGKAYIRQAGLGFMARLFEGTDSNTRKGRQMSQNSKPKEEEGVDLSNKEAESSVTVSAVKIQR